MGPTSPTGGRPVFEYLYLTMAGAQPAAMSADVERDLMSHREALEGVTDAEIEM
jgi:hypothetical protein